MTRQGVDSRGRHRPRAAGRKHRGAAQSVFGVSIPSKNPEAVILSCSLGKVRPMGDEVIEELIASFLA